MYSVCKDTTFFSNEHEYDKNSQIKNLPDLPYRPHSRPPKVNGLKGLLVNLGFAATHIYNVKEPVHHCTGSFAITIGMYKSKNENLNLFIHLELSDTFLDVANNLIGSCKTCVGVSLSSLGTHLLRS